MTMEKSLARADLPAQNGQHGQPTSALAPVRLEAQSLDLMTLCKNLAASGYFKDARDASQAVVKVLYGQELGVQPVTAMMSIHVIEGKPAPSSNLLASIIKRSGVYNYRVRENTRERCLIAFFEHGEEIGTTEWTLEDAKAAGLLKRPTWQSYPRQMLFARCLTEGVRTHCPDLFGGAPVYTPEELGAEVDPETGEPVYREASVPQQPAGQTIELPNRKQQTAASGPTDAQLHEAIRGVLEAIRAQWVEQGLPEDGRAMADYGRRVLGRAPAPKTAPAALLEDYRQILADLSGRPKALQRLCIACQEVGISTHDGESHRQWMASVTGVELPTRKLYTARECRHCSEIAEQLAAEAEAEPAADAPQSTLAYAGDDPFADE